MTNEAFPYIAALLLGAVFSSSANAQQAFCADRDQIVERLKRGYGEVIRAMGMTGGDRMVEVFTSESGSWTIILTSPDNTSCIMVTGEFWEFFEIKPPSEET